jgi:tricorn protease
MELFEISLDGGIPKPLPWGPARHLVFASKNLVVLGRNTKPSFRWKRYRGGTAGQIWFQSGKGKPFRRLLEDVPGNLSDPCVVGERIFFLSDHEGIGNVYSVDFLGGGLTRHTYNDKFYARDLSTDGVRLVFSSGGDLYLLDPLLKKNSCTRIEIAVTSPKTTLRRRFVSALPYLNAHSVNGKSDQIAIVARGQLFVSPLFGGAAVQLRQGDVLRYRGALYLRGKGLGHHATFVTIAFGNRAESLHIFKDACPGSQPVVLSSPHLGRIRSWCAHPKKPALVYVNHRGEIWFLDLKDQQFKLVERNPFGSIEGPTFSPCGKFLAYSSQIDDCRVGIKVVETASFTAKAAIKARLLFEPVLQDSLPMFSQDGLYLYFVSVREFKPIYSATHFQLAFPYSERIYGVCLQAGTSIPSLRSVSTWGGDMEVKKIIPKQGQKNQKKGATKPSPEKAEESAVETKIDFAKIDQRIFALTPDLGHYRQIAQVGDTLFYLEFENHPRVKAESPKGTLKALQLKDEQIEVWDKDVDSFVADPTGKFLTYRKGKKLRVVGTDKKPDATDQGHTKKGGWIDLARCHVAIKPMLEWQSMFDEAWLLQKEFFWTADMSKIDWELIYQRYKGLVGRIASRDELSDLIWEMQGELGTSHCYEMPREQSRTPAGISLGWLGAKFVFSKSDQTFVIESVVGGDSWIENGTSPLVKELGLAPGDRLLAIDGQHFVATEPLERYLLERAGQLIYLTFRRGTGKPETKCIRAMSSQGPALYRQWVEANREKVRKLGKGKIGYLHVPDMGTRGFSEFYRGYLAESSFDALILDVRFNGGGHVSEHLLRMLQQKVIGFDVSRWHGVMPYPRHGAPDVLVCVTNEHAGSDGDMFCHGFKMLELGPLIGTRTWGGVIGISGRHLVDGTYVSQPEYSHWFKDVGYGIENYGTKPDIVIDNDPNDVAAGSDPQLERAVSEALEQLRVSPRSKPQLDLRPNLSLPILASKSKAASSGKASKKTNP